jgi:hypothetical protein
MSSVRLFLRKPVMEYMGGGEVRWRDHDDRPLLTVAQTKRIFRDVVLGLEYRESSHFHVCSFS